MEAGESGIRQRISSASSLRSSSQGPFGTDYYTYNNPPSYPRDPRDARDPRDQRVPTHDPRDSRDVPRDALRDAPRDVPRDAPIDAPRDSPRDAPRDASTMATAALISPNTPYYPYHSSYSSRSSYHPSQSQAPSQGPSSQTSPSAPGMISPVESRRTSDDDMSSHRQSLPSIQEVIGKSAGASFSSSAQPPSIPQQSLPSPFPTNPPPRPFPTEPTADRQPSPRVLHHPSSSSSLYGQRQDPISTYPPNPLRPQLSGRSQPSASSSHPSPPPGVESHQDRGLPPAGPSPHHPQHIQPHQQQSQQQHSQLPPLPPQHSQQSSQQQHQPPPPPLPPQHPSAYHHPLPPRDARSSHDNSPSQHNAYPHPLNQHSPFPPQSVPQQQLPPPPGQTHMPASYPVSPRHSGHSSLPSPFESHQQAPQDAAQDYNRSRTRYDAAVNRQFEIWNYVDNLSRIATNARTIFNFAEAFANLAREEHGPQPMPGRMPGEREVNDMINNAEWLKTMLENVRTMVQETAANERGPGVGRPKPANYDEMDVSMYNEPMAKPYASNEVKKRRGRAAPPGRCHSCNRIDTPEWRRGPDGARTLCNACGLHYAKLERKKQLESRQIRPNHPDDRH